MAGRKSKLTKKLIEDAVKLLEAGAYQRTACKALGIHESTWYRWLDEAEPGNRQYEFKEAIEKATSRVEITAVEKWSEFFGKDWKAIATFLERRFPDRWARRDRTTHEHKGKLKLEIEDKREELKELCDVMEKRASVSGNGKN